MLLFVNGMLLNQTPQPQRVGVQKILWQPGRRGVFLSAHNRNVLLGLNFPTLPPLPRSGQREKRGEKKREKKKKRSSSARMPKVGGLADMQLRFPNMARLATFFMVKGKTGLE